MRTVAVPLLLLVTALAGCTSGPGTDPGADTKTTSTEDAPRNDDGTYDLSMYGVNGDPFFGNASAPVQVVAYEAPGCSSCRSYHVSRLDGILADFADTGRIGYHMLEFTVGYAYDTTGSVAAECAHREGGSAAYKHALDLIFGTQHQSDRLPEHLDAIAAEFGLDTDVLRACYDAQETRDEVDADRQAGVRSGAGSNPGFAVIGPDGVELVRGSVGPRDAIERALAAL